MKKITLLIATAALLFSCSNSPSTTGKTGNAVNDNLFAVAKEINKKCPMPTDENTRLDSATVFNEYMITYHYTVHTVSNKEVDIAKFKTNMQTNMNEKYKTDPQLAVYRDNKIAIAYDYKDKNGGFLCYFICGEK
jgi:major membrane immunogen (membrane-anchored lipoprotein)